MKRPSPLPRSAGQAVAREQERAREQQREHRVPAVLRELLDRRDVLEAGVRRRSCRGGRSARARRRPPSRLPSRVVRSAANGSPGPSVGLEVDGEHLRAVALQPRGDRAADAARRPRDQRGTAPPSVFQFPAPNARRSARGATPLATSCVPRPVSATSIVIRTRSLCISANNPKIGTSTTIAHVQPGRAAALEAQAVVSALDQVVTRAPGSAAPRCAISSAIVSSALTGRAPAGRGACASRGGPAAGAARGRGGERLGGRPAGAARSAQRCAAA